jgi:plasmid stabilization system protein ParE
MAYEVKYEKTAEDDLDSILDYLTNELHNIRAAKRLVGEISRRISYLVDSPELYSAAFSPILAQKGYRTFSVGNYIVFFKVDHEARIVSIVHIVFGKRDYIKYLTD